MSRNLALIDVLSDPTGNEVLNVKEYCYKGVRFLYKPGNSDLVCFFSSFTKKGDIQRYSYAGFLNKNTHQTFLYFLDSDSPSSDPRGTYWLGDMRFSYLEKIVFVIKGVADSLCSDSIQYFGSSKGATGAIMASIMVGYGKVFVNAPQIMVYDYVRRYYPALANDSAFSKDSLNNAIKHLVEIYGYGSVEFNISCGVDDSLHLFNHLVLLNDIGINYKLFILQGGHDGKSIENYIFLLSKLLENKPLELYHDKIFKNVFLYFCNLLLTKDIGKQISLLPKVYRVQSAKKYIVDEYIKAFICSNINFFEDGSDLRVFFPQCYGLEVCVYIKLKTNIVVKKPEYLKKPHFLFEAVKINDIASYTVFLKHKSNKKGYTINY